MFEQEAVLVRPDPSSPCGAGGTWIRRPWFLAAMSLLRVLVGMFFLLAAGAKLSLAEGHGAGVTYGIATFAALIAGHQIVPERFAYAAAISAVVVEIAVGVWLLSHRRERLASMVAIVLLAGFCVYLVAAYIKVGDAPCGCMGKLTSGKLTDALVRNSGLIAVLLPSVLLGGVARPPATRPMADVTS